MAINNFPAQIQGVIEQTNFLDRAFQDALEPNLRYRVVAERKVVESGNGETKTMSRPALIAPDFSALNPANNTGLDNGLTPQSARFEQYQVAISEWAKTFDLSLQEKETLIADMFVQNWELAAQQAATTLDGLASNILHSAYDAGNTFASAAAVSGATSVAVDNIVGFDTTYGANFGLPISVNSSNPVTATVFDGTSGNSKGTITVTAVAADGTNTSTSATVGGKSGTLTVTATTFAIAKGDTVMASDGAVVIRPNNKGSRYALGTSDTLTLQMLSAAAQKLAARNIPKIKNRYVALVDPTIMSQLFADQAFQRAIAGGLEDMKLFKDGVYVPMLGLEFVPTTSAPVFGANAGANVARHAVVVGAGALEECPFEGMYTAAKQAMTLGGAVDYRIVKDICMVTRGVIDRKGDTIAQTWKWTGGFVAPTDILSNSNVIRTTDNARYKRAVVIEVGSAS